MHDSATGEPASELGSMPTRTGMSIMTHILALAWLFSYVFASGQWLHVGFKFGPDGHSCLNCRGVGWVIALIAFLVLLIRWIIYMASAVSFNGKSRKTAFIIDLVIMAMVFVAFALTMVTVKDYFYVSGDLLWALIALVISVILDFMDLRHH